MCIEITANFRQYELNYKKYRLLIQRVRLGIIDLDDLFKEVDQHEIDRLRELCVDEYANALNGEEPNKGLVYYEWIKSVAGNNDLYLLEVLILVATKVTDINYERVDLFLLNYFVEQFEKSDDEDHINYAKYLFEWILDTLDNDTKECTEMLERIFSLDKPPRWYDGFYDQLMKLTLRAPVNERTFSAVKQGLLIETTPEIKEFLEEYLEDRLV